MENGERLLVKTTKRKTKEASASDKSFDFYEPPIELKKKPRNYLAKDAVMLLAKAKKRKIKENRTSDESIGPCKFPSEFEKGPITQEEEVAKDGKRLLNKMKTRKIKESVASDKCISSFRSSSEFVKKPTTHKGKDGEKVLVKAKKRMIKENRTDASIGAYDSPSEIEKGSITQKDQRSVKVDSRENSIHSRTLNEVGCSIKAEVTANELKTKTRKFKKVCKQKKKRPTNFKESNNEEVPRIVNEIMVDEITSVDDDCTKGMKKWLMKYRESRPGLEVLQHRIDEFVTAYEERQVQERKEREAQAAEDGWTVVVHHKGRKKTTDAETGTAVGSVAPAAVMDKMSKKKSKEIALDFYRFQKREAKRTEVMMLQSKFEQDRKRIQQLRAARKFKPY